MNKELQDKLVEKYPEIFQEIGMPPEKSCMAWGIDVGDGWYELIDNLCDTLKDLQDGNMIIAAQIKEKFGGLRFYVYSANKKQFDAIDEAEKLSYKICEKCGTKEGVSQTGGWIKTLCENCKNI